MFALVTLSQVGIGIGVALFILLCVFIYAAMRMSADCDVDRPVLKPMTTLEAKRKLLEKAEEEAAFWAEGGRG